MSAAATVVVCTYNAPDRLDLVLSGLARQTRRPDEILIADDGSTDETAEVVARHAGTGGLAMRHLWHRDHGVRRAAIVNAAVSVAGGDRVAFLDGDCVPDRRWLADHLDLADPRAALCGRRLRLGARWSERLSSDSLDEGVLDSPWSAFLLGGYLRGEVERYHLAIRLPQAVVGWLVGGFKPLMGCNFSVSRAALESVNGYDAAWPGAALLSDDYDLEIRLQLAGIALRPLLHAGTVFHLDHAERPVAPDEISLREARREISEPRAVDGIEEARSRIAAGEVVDRLA